MLKTYRNEPASAIRKGDIVTDKLYGRTFTADSDAIWVEAADSFNVQAGGRWLDVSRTVDIQCEEIDEEMYA